MIFLQVKYEEKFYITGFAHLTSKLYLLYLGKSEKRYGLNFSRAWWTLRLISGEKRQEACIHAEGGHFK